MSENNNAQKMQQKPIPNSDLKDFEKLIGTWETSGGVEGKITFEWMKGEFFLIQRVDLTHDGHAIRGI